jgi:hypothetical protein
LHAPTVREHRVVYRLSTGSSIAPTRGDEADAVTYPDGDGLIECRPAVNAVSEFGESQGCVLVEPLGDVSIRPAAAILESLRQIPVVQGHIGVDTRLQQGVDDTIVVGNTGRVDAPDSLGQ